MGGSSAPKMPSPAAPSPCAPSSSMAALENVAAPSTRHRNVVVTPEATSLRMRALTLFESVERGTTGRCCAPMMSGAMFELRIELAAPGVPPTTLLGPQFWPYSFGIAALINSRDLPRPSCSAYQVHPRKLGKSAFGNPLRRTAQSPSSA